MDVSEWLEALAFSEGEFVSVCHKHSVTGDFKYSVLPPGAVPYYVESMSAEHDIWLGVNPVTGPPRSMGGRGKPEDVTRLAAVFADLDVKPGGCADYGVAQAIVDELAELIGEYPTMVVSSGHGLQPYWAIECGGEDDGYARQAAEDVLLRFGRLVRAVAGARDAKVDSVFDLARILRAPGTRNFKDPSAPIDTSAVAGTGAPMELDTLAERLDEAGIYELPDSSAETDADEPSDAASWPWADTACGYVTSMVRPWMEEPVDARHPWLLRCLVRLECARRNGCVTVELYQGISEMLEKRFVNLLATQEPKRKPHRYEVRDLRNEAIRIAATKTAAGLASELGSHSHADEDLIDAAVKAGKVRKLPTDRNRAKGGSGGQPDGKAATVTPLPTAKAAANYTLTDDGNAQRLVAAWSDRLRYVPERKGWVRWDGTRWRISPDDSPAVRAAVDVARNLPVIPGDKPAMTFKKRSLSKPGILNMVRLAQADANLQVSQEDLDANGYELNTPSGIVDLRTGKLMPHDPLRWHTRITGTPYDPSAMAPRWAQFLRTTFQDDEELISYMQQLLGYAAVGVVFEAVLPFLHGGGDNGKSVLLNTIHKCLNDYATTAPLGFLLASRNEKHATEIASLAGARFVICSEVNEDNKFDEAKIKTLTGGDPITARFMRENEFEFKPTHTLFLMGNHQPKVGAGGTSFWRRLRRIPFDHKVAPSQRIRRYEDLLFTTEGPGILNWIVQGSVDVLANGLKTPASVLDATAEYAEDENILKQWVDERCVTGPAFVTATAELYRDYRKWCEDNGHHAKDVRIFARELAPLGYPASRSVTIRSRSNIALAATAAQREQEDWWR